MRVELHKRQTEAFGSPATELLYGGAAGGGKSFYLRVSAIRWALAVPGLQVYLFRRTFPDLRANHLRGANNFNVLLADQLTAGQVKWREDSKEFMFASGSMIKLAHLEYEADVEKYHGAEIHVALFDELTHVTEYQYRFIRSRVRLGGLEVPGHLKDRLPRLEAGSNPGSVGHAWVKRTWVNAAPPGEIWQATEAEGGKRRQYIPAKVTDNPTLLKNDPDYMANLAGLGSPDLVKAMRDGDWDIVAGQAFEMWVRDKHVIAPFKIPRHWTRFRSIDWGSAKPFSVGWWAISDGTISGIPVNAMVRYREWYGCTGKPDMGIRMKSKDVAKGIKEREQRGEKIAYGVADPAMFNQHDGPSTAENMAREGVAWKRGDNDRLNGYQEVRTRFEFDDETELPMLLVFNTCTDFIRTIPDLVMDADKPEDLDTTQEDHIYDEMRYGCMSRPFAKFVSPPGGRRDAYDDVRDEEGAATWRTA